MQHDYVIDNQAGAAFRADLNNALAAIVSLNSGATEPSPTYAYMLWYDTTAGMLKMRNSANSGWISNAGFLSVSGGSIFGTLNHASTKTVASAATTDLGAQASNNVDISGTATITSFGTASEGIVKWGRFTGALTLTHNATSLILPGGANIVTAANDRYVARSLGSGNWIVLDYVPASGQPISTVSIAKGGTGQTTSAGAFNAIKQAATTSASGVVELATGPEVVSVSPDTNKVLTPSSLTYGQVLGTTGRTWTAGGRLEQWGRQAVDADIISAGLVVTITFPVAFPNVAYRCAAQIYSNDASGSRNMYCVRTELTTTYAKFLVIETTGAAQASWGLDWEAKGS